jgi:hypothetical protein
MGADKPALLDILVLLDDGSPEGCLIIDPVLVDRHRVGCVLYDAAQFGIVKSIFFRIHPFERVDRQTECADRVPNPEELDVDLPRISLAERLRVARIRAVVTLAIEGVGIRYAMSVFRRQKTAITDQADEAAGRISTPAKSQDIHLDVARI